MGSYQGINEEPIEANELNEEGIEKFIERKEDLGPFLGEMAKDGWAPEHIQTYVKSPFIIQYKVFLTRKIQSSASKVKE